VLLHAVTAAITATAPTSFRMIPRLSCPNTLPPLGSRRLDSGGHARKRAEGHRNWRIFMMFSQFNDRLAIRSSIHS
jgi:hypothetical protein